MEVDDPLSAKFRTLVEGLMMTTTSEIVKIFSKFLTETRMEITRSWKEIDQLKQQLEECELQKTEAIERAQMLAELKREDDEVEVSHLVSQPGAQNANTVAPQAWEYEERAECSSLENRRASLENACAGGPEAGASSSEIKKSYASKNNPRHSQYSHGTQTVVEPSNTSQMKGETLANGPSSSTGMLKSKEKKSVVTKRRLKKKHANDMRVARALRDRQHLSMQKRCLCCSLDECYLQASPSRAHQQVPTVYVCRKCEKRFKTHILFKSHKCSMPQSCDRCGQVFATMQGLSAHSREGRPLFSCSQCDQMFATQCAWNLHKRIHDSGTSAQNSINVNKDFKAKLQVRLERISDSQLEAALRTKRFSLKDNPNSCTQNGTAAESLFDSSVEDADFRKVYAVMSASSGEDTISYQSPLAHGSNQIKDEEKQNDERDISGLCSSPKKRKMADCTHDAYNGVFPVEKILKWRNNKGKSEVRVKWMPCTLCGAKFQNTWEPAESFPGFLDDMDEEP
ncbi:uncharacterized protein [Misgurnus anguillicaudatus]|uniref:uncharacterized protein n=1 Tax=Misgurnus anguillicaudatus TaxID=75329 RepID=UPI003CCF607D